MKIKEVMTRDVKSISIDSSASEGFALLQQIQISGLPVVDKENKLVGMFTEKDIIAYILPSYVEKVGRFIYEENPKATKKKFMQLNSITVSELMHKEFITTHEDAGLCEVAKLMLTQKVRRIPIVDKQGKLVGIVARADILKGFTQEI
jgi:CBS domain-containing protein